jgi:hypothetical protein
VKHSVEKSLDKEMITGQNRIILLEGSGEAWRGMERRSLPGAVEAVDGSGGGASSERLRFRLPPWDSTGFMSDSMKLEGLVVE